MLVDVDLSLDFINLSPGATDLENAACIPYAYIDDETRRMTFYRLIAEASTVAEVRAIKAEIADRFGRLPPAALRLLRLAELRTIASAHGIARIDVRKRKVNFYRGHSRQPLLIRNRLPRLTATGTDSMLAQLLKLTAVENKT